MTAEVKEAIQEQDLQDQVLARQKGLLSPLGISSSDEFSGDDVRGFQGARSRKPIGKFSFH